MVKKKIVLKDIKKLENVLDQINEKDRIQAIIRIHRNDPNRLNIKFDGLDKGEKIVKVKATNKRKAHTRKIKVSDKKILRDGINNIDFIAKTDKTIEKILKDGGWDAYNSIFFNQISKCRDAIVHSKNSKIYAMSKLQSVGRSIHVSLLEVNPNQQRQGKGILVMRDIVNIIIDDKNFDKIELTSLDENSNLFYDAIGMFQTNIDNDDYQAEYEGDKKWMKKFISISKKQ